MDYQAIMTIKLNVVVDIEADSLDEALSVARERKALDLVEYDDCVSENDRAEIVVEGIYLACGIG